LCSRATGAGDRPGGGLAARRGGRDRDDCGRGSLKMANNDEKRGAAAFDAELLNVGSGGASEALARAGDRSPDLVLAWIDAKNAAAVSAVAEDESAPRAARKAARRGLNVLKARGVALPERAHIARLGGDAVETHLAWFVPPDANGTGVLLFAARWK